MLCGERFDDFCRLVIAAVIDDDYLGRVRLAAEEIVQRLQARLEPGRLIVRRNDDAEVGRAGGRLRLSCGLGRRRCCVSAAPAPLSGLAARAHWRERITAPLRQNERWPDRTS